VAVVGAGAIGAVIAGALLDAGHAPLVCVRTPIPSLVLDSGGGARQLPVTIAADPGAGPMGADTVGPGTGDLGPVDWVLVTVKAQDTAGAAPWLRRLCGPGTVVVALQNGLDHCSRLAPFVGEAIVLPALVYIASERVAPGRVVHHSGRRLAVPAGREGAHFARLLDGGGLEVLEEADFVTAVWRKLLSNLVINPVTALTMRRVDVMNDPGVEALGRALMAEAVAVARAEGAHLGPADVDGIFDRYRGLRGESDVGSSMYYDRLAGLPLEHEGITGALAGVAQRHGIPIPLNDTILTLLRALERGRALRSPA
jgi:2-dehydropantoate 2-reductase